MRVRRYEGEFIGPVSADWTTVGSSVWDPTSWPAALYCVYVAEHATVGRLPCDSAHSPPA